MTATKTKTEAPAPTIHDQALAQIPGLEALTAATERLREWANTPGLTVEPVDGPAEVLAAARAGRAKPPDIGARMAATEAAVTATARTREAIRRAHTNARAELRNTMKAGNGPALEWLGQRMAEVIADTKALIPALADITSADEAFAAGGQAVEAWTALAHAVETYDQIRHTQREITATFYETAFDGQGPGALAFYTTGLYRNALDYEPTWHRHRADTARAIERENLPGEPRQYVTWLRDHPATPYGSALPARTWWPNPDRGAFLLWVAAKPGAWVPTIDQLEAAHKAATEATATVRSAGANIPLDDQLAAVQAARTTYRKITATKPAPRTR